MFALHLCLFWLPVLVSCLRSPVTYSHKFWSDLVHLIPQTIEAEASFVKRIFGNAIPIGQALATPTTTSQEKAQQACKALSLAFPNQSITSSNQTAYDAEETVNWSLSCQLPAQCFVTPASTAEVQVALKIITIAASKFAVRSGGHNPNPGFASIDDTGVLIDLKNLRHLSLSGDKNILYSGSGNRGQDLQSYTDPHGLSTVFGVNLVVGSSGLTLGGGYPILSSTTGMAADNIQNFEIVLANSSVINANAQSNTDLWQALRGGGNNFGIVTRFDRYTSPVHDIWYYLYSYNVSNYQAFSTAMAQVQENMKSDPKANAYVTADAAHISVVLAYAEPADEPAVFAPFMSLTPMAVLTPPTNGTIYSLAQIMSTPDRHLFYQTASVITQIDADFYTQVWQRYITHTPFKPGTAVSMAVKPFDSAAVAYGKTRNFGIDNIMGHVGVAQTWFGLAAGWANPADASYVQGILSDMNSFMIQAAQSRGIYLPNLFANDAGPQQDVMASYGAPNLAAMKAVSAKYDPHQVFQKLQNGGYLVSHS